MEEGNRKEVAEVALNDVVEAVIERAPYAQGKVIRERRVEFSIPAEKLRDFLRVMKESGFEMLMQITVVDWLNEGKFELVYQLWSVTHSTHAFVRLEVQRDDARLPTVMDIFPVAETYEREAHEFFGINFEGNPRLGPFILEPREYEKHPFRKDFSTLGYVKEVYGEDFDRYDESKTNYVI